MTKSREADCQRLENNLFNQQQRLQQIPFEMARQQNRIFDLQRRLSDLNGELRNAEILSAGGAAARGLGLVGNTVVGALAMANALANADQVGAAIRRVDNDMQRAEQTLQELDHDRRENEQFLEDTRRDIIHFGCNKF